MSSSRPPADTRCEPINKKTRSGATTLIVGIGSPHGDDQVGWLVAEHLRSQFANDDQLHICTLASPSDLLDELDGQQRLFICDACQGAGVVGKWQRMAWPDPRIARVTPRGTHGVGLDATLELAQRLGQLPQEVVLYAIAIVAAPPMAIITADAVETATVVAVRIADELCRA